MYKFSKAKLLVPGAIYLVNSAFSEESKIPVGQKVMFLGSEFILTGHGIGHDQYNFLSQQNIQITSLKNYAGLLKLAELDFQAGTSEETRKLINALYSAPPEERIMAIESLLAHNSSELILYHVWRAAEYDTDKVYQQEATFEVRQFATEKLLRKTPSTTKFVENLIISGQARNLQRARSFLAAAGSTFFLSEIKKDLCSDNILTQRNTLDEIALIGKPELASLLSPLLESPNDSIRIKATWVLKKIQGKKD